MIKLAIAILLIRMFPQVKSKREILVSAPGSLLSISISELQAKGAPNVWRTTRPLLRCRGNSFAVNPINDPIRVRPTRMMLGAARGLPQSQANKCIVPNELLLAIRFLMDCS